VNKTQKDKIRIKDIAKLANVSVGTVDRVLHNRGEVSDETRKQVLNIVGKLGYTPNLLAKSLALKKTYNLGVLMPSVANDNPYWEKPLSGIIKANAEIRDFNARVGINYFNLNNEISYTEEAEKIINTKPDGIIFPPIFPESSQILINECEENKIPYVFLDVNIDGKNNLAYFGQNAFQSGLLAAHLLDYGISNNSSILILKLANLSGITHHLMKREIGFRTFYEMKLSTKNIELISKDIDISSIDNIEGTFDNIFKNTNKIKGIFVTNSRVNCVANYIEKRALKDIILIGYDLTENNRKYLELGIIDFLIGQKPEDQGYKSVLALFNHLVFKREINKVNYSPIDIITKENIDFY